MMHRMTWKTGALTALVAVLAAQSAVAWGPRAQRGITAMAMQVIEQDYANPFHLGGVNHERDVLVGCVAGPGVLAGSLPMGSESDIVQAIANEIQLLRDVRDMGPSSYFAFRMGVLASLVSDAIVPFGFAWTAEEKQLQTQINQDIDAHLDSYGFVRQQRRREYIRDPQKYFEERRAFFKDDKRIIQEDYVNGKGYDAFLSQGGKAYSTFCVEAVADVWHTVLRKEDDPTHNETSARQLTWYFVNEIEYLLNTKHNLYGADKVYKHFESVNPGIAEAYSRIGDIYYAYGTDDAKERGVREWRIAYELGGPERRQVAKKLADHYLARGNAFLANAELPGAAEDDLDNALNAFETALDFDNTNDEAADLIQHTHVLIKERNERFETNVKIIATAQKVQEEADKARLNGDFGNAINTYRQSISLFEAVSDEFKKQDQLAKDSVRRLKKNITDVINEVLDQASDAIDSGERAVEQNKYEEAIDSYAKVPGIVSVIPEDVNPALTQDKNDIIQLSEEKIEEAKKAKTRYQQFQEEQRRQAQQQGG